MNTTLQTFLKIAVTVVAISAFLFFFGYNLVEHQVEEYGSDIAGIHNNLPEKIHNYSR